MTKVHQVSTAISLLAVGLGAAYLAWPEAKIDLITVALFLVAVLPWLAPVMKSVELPGGFKIELQDVRAATEKILSGAGDRFTPDLVLLGRKSIQLRAGLLPPEDDSLATLHSLAREAPNLVLVGLRIEIEKRLRALGQALGIDASRFGVDSLLRQLVERGALGDNLASGLQDLLTMGNSAAHGAPVTAQAARWSLDVAPRILGDLDDRLVCDLCGKQITMDDEVAEGAGPRFFHKACVRSQPAT